MVLEFEKNNVLVKSGFDDNSIVGLTKLFEFSKVLQLNIYVLFKNKEQKENFFDICPEYSIDDVTFFNESCVYFLIEEDIKHEFLDEDETKLNPLFNLTYYYLIELENFDINTILNIKKTLSKEKLGKFNDKNVGLFEDYELLPKHLNINLYENLYPSLFILKDFINEYNKN